jgi:hypothetical protein
MVVQTRQDRGKFASAIDSVRTLSREELPLVGIRRQPDQPPAFWEPSPDLGTQKAIPAVAAKILHPSTSLADGMFISLAFS